MRWLWEDNFLEDYKTQVEKQKEIDIQNEIIRKQKSKDRRAKEKDKAIRRSETYRTMTESIFSKITQEELNWLKSHIRY